MAADVGLASATAAPGVTARGRLESYAAGFGDGRRAFRDDFEQFHVEKQVEFGSDVGTRTALAIGEISGNKRVDISSRPSSVEALRSSL